MSRASTKFFACYDENVIWGVGATRAAAVDDALEFAPELRECKVGECSEALYRQVMDHGGNISWDVVDGVALTVEESEVAE